MASSKRKKKGCEGKKVQNDRKVFGEELRENKASGKRKKDIRMGNKRQKSKEDNRGKEKKNLNM